jgi:hypothetical protein
MNLSPAWIEKIQQTNSLDFYTLASQLLTH